MRLGTLRVPTSRRGRLLLAGCATPVLALVIVLLVIRAGGLPSDAAFRADGVIMTKSELAHRTKMLGALYGISAPSDPARQDEFRRDAARLIANTVVIDHAAQARRIVISDSTAQQGLAALIGQLEPPGEDSFVQLLEDTGASRSDVLDEIKRQDRSAELADQITQPAVRGLTEADYQNFYREHPEEQSTPEQRHLRNIVVATEAEADQIAGRARAGEDFGAMASESSLDDATRSQGGDLGLVTRDRLEANYAATAFSAPVGSTFGPVRTNSGWNVGQVVEDRPSAPRTYAQARPEIVNLVRGRTATQAWTTWLSAQVAAADVRYAAEFQPPGPAPVPAAANPPKRLGAG